MYSKFLKEYRQHLQVCHWLLFAPYKIQVSQKTKKPFFTFDSSLRHSRLVRRLAYFTTAYLIIGWLSQLMATYTEVVHLQAMSLGMILLFSMSWVNRYPHTKPGVLKQIVILLNAGLHWEKNHFKNQPKKSGSLWLISITLHLMNLSGPIFSLFMFPFSFYFVKLPPFPGFLLYNLCLRISVSFPCDDPRSIFFMRIMSSTTSCVSILAASTLGVTIEYEILLYLISIIRFTKSITLSPSTPVPTVKVLTALKKFQQLRILDIAFNSIYKQSLLGTLVMVQILVVVIGYCVLKLHKLYSSMEIAAFGLVALNIYVVLTVILTLAGKVLTISFDTNAHIKYSADITSNRFLRKSTESLKPLKVMMGSVNFIDNSTPLIVMSFCVEQTVSLTLM